jgi:hypothetical protein
VTPYVLLLQVPVAGRRSDARKQRGFLAGPGCRMALKLGGGVRKKRNERPPAVAAAFFCSKGEEAAEDVAEAVARRAVVGRLQEEGNQLAEAGQLRGALSKFRSAAALEPGSAVLQELQAQVWMGLGEWWQAVQAAERATQRDPQFGEGWVTLARAQLNLGEFRMAVASFERGASLVSAAAAAELDVPADLARAKELRAQQLATGWRRPGCAASRVAAARREATMASLQDELPPGLCAALRAGSCVLYTGSGFSIPAGLPSWAELLVRVAREGGCAQLLPACSPESAGDLLVGASSPSADGDGDGGGGGGGGGGESYGAGEARVVEAVRVLAKDGMFALQGRIVAALGKPLAGSLIERQLNQASLSPLPSPMMARLDCVRQSRYACVVTQNWDGLLEQTKGYKRCVPQDLYDYSAPLAVLRACAPSAAADDPAGGEGAQHMNGEAVSHAAGPAVIKFEGDGGTPASWCARCLSSQHTHARTHACMHGLPSVKHSCMWQVRFLSRSIMICVLYVRRPGPSL